MSIYSELSKENINWEKLEEIIKSYGDDINKFDEDFTPLSEIMLEYADSGRADMLLKVIDLFLENGFDVKGNNGHNGVSCLYYLMLRCKDGILTQIIEKFLDAGTDTKVAMYEDDEPEGGILYEICRKLGQWSHGDYKQANLYEAAYQMVEAYEENRPYKGIRTVNDCIGKTVKKVEKITLDKEEVSSDISSVDSFTGALVIWADNMPLIVSEYVDFVVNPYTPGMAVNRLDISEDLQDIIGAEIEGVEFASPHSAWMLFSNGSRLKIIGDREWGNEKDSKVYYTIIKNAEACQIKAGTVINRIYLKNGFHWSETVLKYAEPTMLITVGDKAYQIYVHRYPNGNKALITEGVPINLIGTSNRRIAEKNFVVGAVMLNDNDQAVLIHLLDKDNGNIFIVPDDRYDKVSFCRIEVNDKGEEVGTPMNFIDESEWGKQEFPHQT